MSVVNKMLNDLEQRQGAPITNAIYYPPKANPTRKIVLLLLVVLASGLYASYLWLAEAAEPNTTAVIEKEAAKIPSPEPTQVPVNAIPAKASATSLVTDDVGVADLVETANVLTEDTSNLGSNADEAMHDEPQLLARVISADPPPFSKPQAASTSPASAESSFSLSTVELSQEQQLQQLKQHIQIALAQGDKALAISKLGELLAKEPTHSKGRQKLANLLHEQGKSFAAETVLREGLALNADDSYQRLMLARLLLINKQLQAAMNLLQSQMPRIDKHTDYYAFIADLARQLGNNELALSTYTHLVTHAPSNARWWLGQAISADQLAQPKVAKLAYQQALELQQLDESVVQFIRQRLSEIGG